MTREEAYHDLSQEYYNPVILKEDIEFVKKKLKFSDLEFKQIMTAKPKRFDDYPSYETHILFRYIKKNFKSLQHRFPFLKRIGF